MSNENLAAEAVASKVLALAAGLSNPDVTVNSTCRLCDLGFDDLDAVELVMAVEDELGVDINVDEYDDNPDGFLNLPLQALIDKALAAMKQRNQDQDAASSVAALCGAAGVDMGGVDLGGKPEKAVGHRVYRGKGSLVVEQPVTEQAPKLTPADIESVIVGEHYFTADQGIAGALAMNQGRSRFFAPSSGGMERVTYCVLELRNGAKVTGVNHGPVSAANFDAAKGREYARENAIEKVWELEGYALRERLAAPVVSASFLLNATPEQEADLLEKLRTAPLSGIFLTALDPDAGKAVAALPQAAEAMRAFTDPEGNMPADTGEFNDLKEALADAEEVQP